MMTLFRKLREACKRARLNRRLERERSHLPYCLKKSGIRMEDLIPLSDDEYDRLVADLESKVNRMKADEPEFSTHDVRMPNGGVMYNYTLRNILAWREIVDSMKDRARDAYYLKNRPCEKCGGHNTVYFCFRSSKQSWRESCGREGYMLICPDCLTILNFVHYLMN